MAGEARASRWKESNGNEPVRGNAGNAAAVRRHERYATTYFWKFIRQILNASRLLLLEQNKPQVPCYASLSDAGINLFWEITDSGIMLARGMITPFVLPVQKLSYIYIHLLNDRRKNSNPER